MSDFVDERLHAKVLRELDGDYGCGRTAATSTSLARGLSSLVHAVDRALGQLAQLGKVEHYEPGPELADHPKPHNWLPPRAEWTEVAWQLTGAVHPSPQYTADEYRARAAERERLRQVAQAEVDAFNREHPVGTRVTWTNVATHTWVKGDRWIDAAGNATNWHWLPADPPIVTVQHGAIQWPATRPTFPGTETIKVSLALDGKSGTALVQISEVQKTQ